MNETTAYLPLPTVCANCTNRLLIDGTANPRQSCVSVYCPHEQALISGRCGRVRGERIIGPGSVSGPMSWMQRRKRVSAIDIETCPDCGGKLRVIAAIEDPLLIRLSRMGHEFWKDLERDLWVE